MPEQTRLDQFNNAWYQPGSALKRGVWYLINACLFNSYVFPLTPIKVMLLRLFGAKIGKGLVLKPKVNIKYPWKLEIGDHCWIGENVWIDNLGQVKIGNHVCLSQGSMLLCGNHDYSKSTFDLMVGDITLEDGVWIGAKAMVGPGTICHSHAVLSACSFTSKHLEAYGIYAGVPAVKVKDRQIS